MKSEEEVEEEEEEEVDPDAQPMDQYEEEFIGNTVSNIEEMQRALVSGNEEDASEDDTQMENRY